MKRSFASTALRQGIRLMLSGAVVCGLSTLGQTLENPGFEKDTFTVSPGYIIDNTPITGWTANADMWAGLNPAGDSLFADNGAIPEGKNVAFLLPGGTLSTVVNGLTAGQAYKVMFQANASTGQTPVAKVLIDDVELLNVAVYPVTGTAPYGFLACEFTATGASQTLMVANEGAEAQTLLVDNFTVTPSSGRWEVASWTADEDSAVDSNFVYTHAYNFGSAESVTINGIPFTGIAGGLPRVTGQFSTTYLGNVFTGDNDANLTGASKVLGRDFVYGGTVPAGLFQSIKIDGLTVGREYVVSVYSVGFDSPGPTIRWATFSVGNDRLTVNQDQFENNGGIRLSYRYVADDTGSVTFRYAPVNPQNVSIHTYGFSNREATTRNVAPEIAAHPRGVIVSAGQAVSFAVSATGIPAPTYQWRFKGANIAGATEASYTLASVTSANAGDYDVVVKNSMGTVTSSAANLTVGITINNASFDADTFGGWPGYVSANFPITDWTSMDGHGINPVEDGQSPFADNGLIPHGRQVAFLQADGALSQLITGLTPGTQYYLHYYENSRTTVVPALEVKLGDATLVAAHQVPPVGGANLYRSVYSDVFTASAAEAELAFIKSNPNTGDSTALVDSVAIVPVPAGTTPFVSRPPQAVAVSVGSTAVFTAQGIGSLPLAFQWRKDGQDLAGETGTTLTLANVQKPQEGDYTIRISNGAGSVESAPAHLTVYEPVPDLFNTGVDAARNVLPDGAVDPHYKLVVNPDVESTDAIVEDTKAFPISDGTWLRASTTSAWVGPRLNTVESAVGSYTYRTSIDLTDRDPTKLVILGRWSTDNAGVDIRVNGVSTENLPNTGFNVWTPFALYGTNINFIAASNSIDFVVENQAAIGYTGLRVEYTMSNLPIPAGVPPEILTHPLSQTVAEGDTVILSANARGTAPLSYQWKKNGVALPGQTTSTLQLNNVKAEDSGDYTITVSNSAGTATSNPAALCVCLRLIPGIFGSGVDDQKALLPADTVDPHYKMTASADGGYPGPDAITVNDAWPVQAGVWLLNGPDSRWIAPLADQSVGIAPGAYTFETKFDLTGYDLSKVSLVGGWAVDNTGVDIVLNGNSTGFTSTGFAGLTPFTITTGFVQGVNTLEFQMSNLGDAANPGGIRIDLRGYQSIAPAAKPTLSITRSGANVSVAWSPTAAGQKLQGAPAVTGPWNEVSNATNPYVAPATGTTQYFRVVAP